MKLTHDEKILSTITSHEFVERSVERERLVAHARARVPSVLSVLKAPGSGATELLLQLYDRLFRESGEVIPLYFCLRHSEKEPRDIAERFVTVILEQTVAFRRRDPSLLNLAQDPMQIVDSASPADSEWAHGLASACNDRSSVRVLFAAALRPVSPSVRPLLIIDNIEVLESMPGSRRVLADFSQIAARAGVPCVIAGARRFLFAKLPGPAMRIDPPSVPDVGRIAEVMATRYGVATNDQTRDLIAVQTNCNLRYLNLLFAGAADRGESLESFKAVESSFTEEIFGGRISLSLDEAFDRIVPETARTNVLKLLFESRRASDERIPISAWRERSALEPISFRKMLQRLHTEEFVSCSSGSVRQEPDDQVFTDYIRGRAQLELDGAARAQVIGESLAQLVKRAPELMGRFYRRTAAIGVKDLVSSFDGQEIAEELIDYSKFKRNIKGSSESETAAAIARSESKFDLPHIVFAANTSSFYPRINELIDDERSAIGFGFEEMSSHTETVWITAEIASKLEIDVDLTEFWCDRLEMVALTRGFDNYRIWLISPEGFSDEALERLQARGALGSSRGQIDLLRQHLSAVPGRSSTSAVSEYEMVIPMGGDTEMIAAHTLDEIARKHDVPTKIINQIKTALVEACINAGEHSLSPDRRIYQRFQVSEEKISVTVANRGIRLVEHSAIGVESDEGRRGWGLKLMRSLMDEVKIEGVDDGTRISLVKYLRPAAKIKTNSI